MKLDSNVVKVAVIGPPKTGKTSLCACMNGRIVRRYIDLRRFWLCADELEAQVDLVEDLPLSDYHFILVVFGIEADRWTEAKYESIEPLLQSLRHSYPQIPTAVVGSKKDLLRGNAYYRDLCLPPKSLYRNGVEYFSVSTVTGAGLSDLSRYIVDGVYNPTPLLPLTAMISAFHSFSRLGTTALDIFARVFALPIPEDVNKDTLDTEDLDDVSLERLIDSPMSQAWIDDIRTKIPHFRIPPTYRIAPTLIAKDSPSQNEAANMTFVRQHTRIPVPQPRCGRLTRYLVMDYVEGEALRDCWGSLGLFTKFRIACTLRTYISQLRQLHRDVPGNLSICAGTVSGAHFEEWQYGPFGTSQEFQRFAEYASFCGWASNYNTRSSRGLGPLPRPPRRGHWSLCFIHGDLNLGNIILSKDNVLWLVDWQESGFYPPWLELWGMKRDRRAPSSWKWLLWLCIGSSRTYERFWDYAFSAFEKSLL